MKQWVIFLFVPLIGSCALARLKPSESESRGSRSISSIESTKIKKAYPPDVFLKNQMALVSELTHQLASDRSKDKKNRRLFVASRINSHVKAMVKESALVKANKKEFYPWISDLQKGAKLLKSNKETEGLLLIYGSIQKYQLVYDATDWSSLNKKRTISGQ